MTTTSTKRLSGVQAKLVCRAMLKASLLRSMLWSMKLASSTHRFPFSMPNSPLFSSSLMAKGFLGFVNVECPLPLRAALSES